MKKDNTTYNREYVKPNIEVISCLTDAIMSSDDPFIDDNYDIPEIIMI